MTQDAAFREHEASIQRTLKEQSESNQRAREQSDFVIPSEPKVLRLVMGQKLELFKFEDLLFSCKRDF